MLFLINEYAEKYPNRNTDISFLKKFNDCEKYLHEMTANEITTIVNKWSPLAPQTEYIRRRNLINYLNFLKEQGVKVTLAVNEIKFPVAEKEHNIYSTKDIARYYDILFNELEKNAAKTGKTFDKSTYLMSYASGILAFLGIQPEDILELNLCDVHSAGVSGYNLPLTSDDIDILLRYKNLNVAANRMRLVGDKYIRATLKTKGDINVNYLVKPIWRTELDNEHIYLRSLLSVHTLYKFGVFDRIYRYEIANNVLVKPKVTTPEWFAKIVNAENMTSSELTNFKSKYYAYREDRDKSNTEIETETEVVAPAVESTKESNSDLIDRLAQAYVKMNEAMAIINEIQNELIKIKK